jgi:Mannosyltransferase (PIG-V)
MNERWLTVAGWFLASRLAILALGAVGVATFTNQRALASCLSDPASISCSQLAAQGAAALNPKTTWLKWDAEWYERIASHGYAYERDTPQGQAAAGYFPFYPLVVRAVWTLAPGLSFFWVASLFSNIVTFIALLLLARALVPARSDLQQVLAVLMTSAGSFYLSIPYSESLFLLLVIGVLIATQKRQYELAGLLAGISATTRVHGLALVAVPAVASWLDLRLPTAQRRTRAAVAVALFALPVAAYFVYLSSVQGSWTAFVARQELWDNPAPYPLRAFAGFVEFPRRITNWLHGGFWFLYAGLLWRYRKQMPPGEALFCLGALLISTQQEAFHGTYRYVVPLIPLSIAIARDRAEVRNGVIAFNLVFGTLMLLAFVTWNRLTV